LEGFNYLIERFKRNREDMERYIGMLKRWGRDSFPDGGRMQELMACLESLCRIHTELMDALAQNTSEGGSPTDEFLNQCIELSKKGCDEAEKGKEMHPELIEKAEWIYRECLELAKKMQKKLQEAREMAPSPKTICGERKEVLPKCRPPKQIRVPDAENTRKTCGNGFFARIFRQKSEKQPQVTEEPVLMPQAALFGAYGMSPVQAEPEVEPLKISDVQFSAVVKKQAERDTYLPIDILMYEDEFRSIIDERLDDTTKETKSGYHQVVLNAKVRVLLSSKDIELNDCEEERIWTGKYLEFGFMVEVPEDYPKKQILFCANVYLNDVIATRLKFTVDIRQAETIEIQREDILSAFVSYASNDRERVVSIVQGMQKARPEMDIFLDVEKLRSGQNWKDALRTEIDQCSTFFLCWSSSASKSKWVDFEWRYALEKKGEACIEPIPIEPPEECPPPVELSQKHFNDKLIYVIKGIEAIKRNTAYLVHKETGERITIRKDVFTIGRLEAHVDYVITENRISKLHAEIVKENGQYFLVDLQFTNKTYIDGVECQPYQKVILKNGSVISFANIEFVFELY